MADRPEGRFDLAGNWVYDDPELQRMLGKSVSQVDAERRVASYTWHKNAGTLDVWYEQNDAGNNPYSHQESAIRFVPWPVQMPCIS